MGTSISELRKTLWRYVAMFVLWRFYIVLYNFYVISYSFRLLYRFTSLSVVYLCCLFNFRWQSVYDIRYGRHVSTVSKTWCLPPCVRDPACNRDPASISTICLDPRPVSGTRLLSGDLRYIYLLGYLKKRGIISQYLALSVRVTMT